MGKGRLHLKSHKREGKNPDKNSFVSGREQQKSGSKLPRKFLTIAKQSFRELQKTPKIRENFGIKSPQEAPPNERPEGRRPENESRVEIHNNIIAIDKSGDPQVCRIGLKPSHTGTTRKMH